MGNQSGQRWVNIDFSRLLSRLPAARGFERAGRPGKDRPGL